jgi:hypothetical protein
VPARKRVIDADLAIIVRIRLIRAIFIVPLGVHIGAVLEGSFANVDIVSRHALSGKVVTFGGGSFHGLARRFRRSCRK